MKTIQVARMTVTVNAHNKSLTCLCQMRVNAFGQVENCKEHETTKATTSPHEEKKGQTYSLQSTSSSQKK